MPEAFPKPCPICRRQVIRPPAARCTDCERGRKALRDRPWAHYYGHAWQTARKTYLAAHPFCVECLSKGREVRAIELDHIRPHNGSIELFWNRRNWQPLCKRHHARKTLLENKRNHPQRFTKE